MNIVDQVTMFHMAVTDMAKSREFYADKLGFRVTKDYEQGDQHWVSIDPPGGGTSINLTTAYENFLKPGTMKLYFSTPDVEQSYEELRAKGIKPTTEIVDGWGAGKLFEVRDPDGNRLFIVQS